MIALTSISPNHANGNIQTQATDSWMEHGCDVYSFNSPHEIISLSTLYPKVTFIPTHRTMEGLFGKPYVCINAFLDFAKEKGFEEILLINSDIIIKDKEQIFQRLINKSKEGIVILTRYDFNGNDMTKSNFFDSGFDGFIINKNFFNLYPQSIYAMGMTHWDYWIPFRAILNKIPIFKIKEKLLFHKVHPLQYDVRKWQKMSKYFQFENDINTSSPQQVSDRTHLLIKSKLLPAL